MLRALLLLTLASVAHAADAEWLWIKTQSLSNEWAVSTGRAEVKLQGGRFTAKLYSKTASDQVQITLTGTVANRTVSVKETVHNSDFSGSSYKGQLTRKTWPRDAYGITGTEVITLSDGATMIGISRSLFAAK